MSETTDFHSPRRDDDPSTKIWSLYLDQAGKHNKILTENWKGDMDAILIFAGLFSASVTSFIIESYGNLIPNDADTTVILLAQIYRQLSNDTVPELTIPSVAQALNSDAFVPSTSSLICNVLWFLSLSLSLTAALSATMVQQWTRNYLQATVGPEIPHQRARINAYLYEGITKFHMEGIVAAIPLLLHASLLLFFAGLVEFLRPVNPGISYLIFGLLLLSAILYLLVTILPVFRFDCPYRTPLTKMWWKILCSMHLIRRRKSQGGYSLIASDCSLDKVREWEATDISNERDSRDFRAMLYTLEYSPDDNTLEHFSSIIPDVVRGSDFSAKLLCLRLLGRHDPTMRLGFRLTRLLQSCIGRKLDPKIAKRRSMSTLSAIWSLSMMALPASTLDDGWRPLQPSKDIIRFDERTLGYIEKVPRSIPDALTHCISTASVIARSLLDLFSDRMVNLLKIDLWDYVRTGHLPERYRNTIERSRYNRLLQRDTRVMLERIDKEAADIEQRLAAPNPDNMLSPSTYASLDSLLRHIQDITVLVLRDHASEHQYIHEILDRLDNVQKILRQAGFLLILDFIGYTLKSPTLPYEAFNTTRRLYLRLQLNPTHLNPTLAPFSLHSQSRLVRYLDDALDLDHSHSDGSRLPKGVVNILLGLICGINDPECVFKAKDIVSTFTKVCTSPPNLDAAQRALVMLDMALPDDDRPKEALDIFKEHLYSNTKLTRAASEDIVLFSKAEPHWVGPD